MSTISLVKIAFIVEGVTESLFIEKLLTEIFNENQIAFEKLQQDQTKKGNLWTVLETATITKQTKYYILIVNCYQDSKVATYIRDNSQGLIKQGFSTIVGLLDLYPKERSELDVFQFGLKAFIPREAIPIVFVISVMEIEAWFIGEKTHFEKIDKSLTLEFIKEKLGIDLETIDFEAIPHPTKQLDSIYKLAGKGYIKKKAKLERTVKALDFAEIYLELPNKIKSLKDLIEIIDASFY